MNFATSILSVIDVLQRAMVGSFATSLQPGLKLAKIDRQRIDQMEQNYKKIFSHRSKPMV